MTFEDKECMEIGSAQDWKRFCQLVNDGQTTFDAKLTANIDLSTDITQVGTETHRYSGIFDGNGYSLKMNWTGNSALAPFKCLENATVKNLKTEGHITVSQDNASGLINESWGNCMVSNCINKVDITVTGNIDASSAGMINYVNAGANVTINDCVVTGNFNGTTDKAKLHWAGFVYRKVGKCTLNSCLYLGTSNASEESLTFINDGTANLNECYYLKPCGGAQGEEVNEERLKSGEIAYKLQRGRGEDVWGQTIGSDNEPQFNAFTKKAEKVYQVAFVFKDQVKTARYANKGKTVKLPTLREILGEEYDPKSPYALNFSDGFSETTPVNADTKVIVTLTFSGDFKIAKKEDWKEFCDLVNNKGINGVNVKLMNDIDLGENSTMVGTESHKYGGTFDGQGHTLTVHVVSNDQGTAPFHRTNGATIQNLTIDGTVTAPTNYRKYDSNYHTAGLVGFSENTTLRSCVVKAAIHIGNGYDQYSGGLVGHTLSGTTTIEDCAFIGSIIAYHYLSKISGLVAWGDGGTTIIRNSYVDATYIDVIELNPIMRRKNSSTNIITNVYYSERSKGRNQDDNMSGNVGVKISDAQVKNGEAAKMLQGDRDELVWGQEVGDVPVPYGTVKKDKANFVYYNKEDNSWTCDNLVLTDEKAMPVVFDFTAKSVTYDRDFSNAKKATLCLPYELSVSGFKAYALSGGNTSRVYFTDVTTDRLEAYKPYLLEGSGTVQLGGKDIKVKAFNNAAMTTPAQGYTLHGTVTGMDNNAAADANAYILQSDGMFHKVTKDNANAMIPAYRAYITLDGMTDAKLLSVVIDGETTDINGVTDDATDISAAVYDLQGRRVADSFDAARHALPAGVYIVGNRKVIVK